MMRNRKYSHLFLCFMKERKDNDRMFFLFIKSIRFNGVRFSFLVFLWEGCDLLERLRPHLFPPFIISNSAVNVSMHHLCLKHTHTLVHVSMFRDVFVHTSYKNFDLTHIITLTKKLWLYFSKIFYPLLAPSWSLNLHAHKHTGGSKDKTNLRVPLRNSSTH